MGYRSPSQSEKRLLNQAIGWDTVNWSKAISFWEGHLGTDLSGKTALELGAGRNGGLSLWLAKRGATVTCSGYRGVPDEARRVHEQFGVAAGTQYLDVDATSITCHTEYDIVALKSVLGGIVRQRTLSVGKQVADGISHILRPGGVVLFAENMAATRFHKLFRDHFGAGKNHWKYFKADELVSLFADFTSLEYRVFGFLGCFGPIEPVRRGLGRIDSLLCDRVVPEPWRYIMAGIAVK